MGRCYPGTNTLFESVERHDAFLLSAINAVVEPDDELFILGDFADNKPGKYRLQIKCKHVKLIMGNHDRVQASLNVFGDCPAIRQTKLRGVDEWGEPGSLKCVLCHYPLAYWEGSHNGTAHLYGHTHGQREDTLNGSFPGRRAFDVTVDHLMTVFGSYMPVCETTLYGVFKSWDGHDPTSYYDRIKAKRDKRLGL
jgi:calcineurin-like phosphoesterase family protein